MARIEQKSVSSALTARYGFGHGFQLRATAPYQYSIDQVSVNSYRVYEHDESNFGPARVSVQKELFSEGSGYPGLIIGVGGLLGSTYGLSVETSLSKTLDPAILFGAFQYVHQFDTENSLYPENRVSGQLGFGLKLNDDLAMQLALVGRYTGEIVSKGGLTPGRDDFGINAGLNWRVAKNIFLQPFVESLLTADGNDISVGTAIIYTPVKGGH